MCVTLLPSFRTLFFTSRSPCKSVSLRPSFPLAANCSRYQPQPSSQLDKMINSCRNRLKSTVDRNLNRKIYLLTRKCSSAPVTAPMSMMNMAGVAVFSSICFGAIGLGIWQTKRYAWKIGVIEQSKTKLNDAADIIPDLKQADLVAYVSQMRGRRVSVTGTFDHSNEILLGPRSAPAGLMGAVAQGLAINPQVIEWIASATADFRRPLPENHYLSTATQTRDLFYATLLSTVGLLYHHTSN